MHANPCATCAVVCLLVHCALLCVCAEYQKSSVYARALLTQHSPLSIHLRSHKQGPTGAKGATGATGATGEKKACVCVTLLAYLSSLDFFYAHMIDGSQTLPLLYT
jgi:hypothetical protein